MEVPWDFHVPWDFLEISIELGDTCFRHILLAEAVFGPFLRLFYPDPVPDPNPKSVPTPRGRSWTDIWSLHVAWLLDHYYGLRRAPVKLYLEYLWNSSMEAPYISMEQIS